MYCIYIAVLLIFRIWILPVLTIIVRMMTMMTVPVVILFLLEQMSKYEQQIKFETCSTKLRKTYDDVETLKKHYAD